MVATEHLELRPLSLEAARALAGDRAAAARLIGAVLPDGWPHPDLLDLPAREPPYGIWAIVERETGTVVGDAGFHGPPGASGTVELGYSVLPFRRRRGYASEAARALTGWALAQPGVSAVIARCDPGNAASIGTLERAGFRRTGEAGGLLGWAYP